MAKPEKTLLGDCELTSPGVTLTDSLIATRSQPRPVEPLRPESQSTELPSPSTVRLDRENICAIGRRQSLREIHSLYLQQVPLPGWKLHPQSGEPAAPATSARPGLVPQPDTDAGPRWEAGTGPDVAWVCPRGASEELPRSLRLLDLTGNECTHQHGYRFLCGSAPGAGRALTAEAEGGPGGTLDPSERAGGAAGTSGFAAAPRTAEPRQGGSRLRRGPRSQAVSALSPNKAGDTSATPASILPAAPASSQREPVPDQGSRGGDWHQRSKK
ncbi:leucine-rich repeat-containing protein 46 isoform X2 [Tyto alba]|uniref:leucine-rich repeat-containing protein 46 isoform X2 n=1 Tax=Tyto alba TaxID=56313 RepID=UPI001C670016|nr:leucine-rich repeat-containing protein 46 isoform X2 [Tyto alba]